jgi:CRISPR-associated protein Cas1
MRSLVLGEPSLALQARKGSLCIRERDGTETLHPARVHGLKTILLTGHCASVTSEAMRWCAREAVALYLMERSGECLALLAEGQECDARRSALTMRQRQFRAVLSPGKRLEIARKLVAAKLQTLELCAEDARDFKQEIREAYSLESLLVAEARAGAAYFMRWRGFELRFKDHNATPQHWHVFTARAAGLLKGRGGTSKARHAATPMGAMLNYAYVVGLGQVTRATIGAGLDACHGFLHSPKPGRLSLSYDILEFHRTAITERVFGFAGQRIFKRDDFELDPHGVVRLGGPIAREIAGLALKAVTVGEAAKSVQRVIKWF